MRILHWSDGYPPLRGGTETVVHRLATTMAADGHAVAVVSDRMGRLPPLETVDDVAIHRFDFRDMLDSADAAGILRTIRDVAALKRAFAADMIHLHCTSGSGFFHLRTAAAHPCPTVVTIHGPLGGCAGGVRSLLGQILAQADHVTGVSQAMVADACEVAPAIAARASVIFNGDDRSAPVAPRHDPPMLFAFGRHVRDKGFDLAIAAMPAIRAAHPAVRLVIGSDGPERPALEAQARQLGLDDAVTFTGWIDDDRIRALIDGATAVIVPSRWREGFGLVALEAALAHRPVVATAMGGLPEVVVDGETGIVVAPENVGALAGAVLRLLADPGWGRKMGDAAARRAAVRFSLRGQIDAFTRLYADLKANDRHR